MIDITGYRKLGLGLLIIFIGVGITLTKGDISANMVTLLNGVFLSFVGGNMVAKVAAAYANGNQPEPDEAQPVATVAEDPAYKPSEVSHEDPYLPVLNEVRLSVEEIKVTLTAVRNAVALTQQALGQSLTHTSTIIEKAGFNNN